MHRQGIEFNAAGQPASAVRVLRRALRMLDGVPAGEALFDLSTRVTATLAHSEAELGRVDVAGELLHAAMDNGAGLSAEAVGILHNQHGLLLLRQGHLAMSVGAFDRAMRGLRENPESQCVVLLNRSAAHLYRGDAERAGEDLVLCAQLASRYQLMVLEAKARHNLGYLSLLRRDLPSALRDLGSAYEALSKSAPGYSGIILLDRARVLRDAGLLDEADAELADAISVLEKNRLDQDLGEALLVRAEIALMAGRMDDARTLARVARKRFRHRKNNSWVLLADLLIVQAAQASGRHAVRSLPVARDVAARLHQAGLDEDARLAALVADRIELRAGGRPEAPEVRRSDRIAARLQVRLVRSELARASGDEPAARREIRRGLDDLQRHRSGLGSYDLQTGAGLHGRQMIESALLAALRDGRPSVVYSWIERTRAVSLRVAPVRPPGDPVLASALAELRALRAAGRAGELGGGRPDAGLAPRRAELERVVRQRSWHVAGRPSGHDRIVGLGRIRSEIARSEGVLVAFIAAGSALHAVVATGSRARLVALGAVESFERIAARLRADLDAMAVRNLPSQIRRVIANSLESGLSRLDAELWRPLAHLAGAGPVLLVPSGVLNALPWTCLPSLMGRPVTVAPSATWWYSRNRGLSLRGPTTFAAGPGLERAEEEVRSVAHNWSDATVLLRAEATVSRVLERAGSSRVLHLAAHGKHEIQNPLFSSLDLADGPLLGYDLPLASRMPAHVVLSACDVGLAVVRAGDEPLGMTAAFLQGGVTSVVASVARVSDDIACEVMTDYHRRLSAGRSPAEALAETLERARSGFPGQPAPFIAIGAAW